MFLWPIFALQFAGVLRLMPPANAQTTRPRPKTVWYGEFTLTIKGKGEKLGEFDGDADIFWKVDRTYYSNFTLNGPFPSKSSPTTDVFQTKFSKANPLTVHVTVADEVKVTKNGRYQHDSYENVTQKTLWEEDAAESGGSSGNMSLSVRKGSFEASFVGLPSLRPNNKNLKITRSTETDRSEYGFGDKPRHEVKTDESIFEYVTVLRIPKVTVGLELTVVGGVPVFYTKGPLVPGTIPSLIKCDSTPRQPDEPMIEGVPDSKTNLKVILDCRFSRTPFY